MGDGLLHRFADYYFDALDAYDADPARTPAVWRVAHEATRAPRTSAVQHLLLGLNAPINYGLVRTLVDVLEPEWARLDGGSSIGSAWPRSQGSGVGWGDRSRMRAPTGENRPRSRSWRWALHDGSVGATVSVAQGAAFR